MLKNTWLIINRGVASQLHNNNFTFREKGTQPTLLHNDYVLCIPKYTVQPPSMCGGDNHCYHCYQFCYCLYRTGITAALYYPVVVHFCACSCSSRRIHPIKHTLGFDYYTQVKVYLYINYSLWGHVAATSLLAAFNRGWVHWLDLMDYVQLSTVIQQGPPHSYYQHRLWPTPLAGPLAACNKGWLL